MYIILVPAYLSSRTYQTSGITSLQRVMESWESRSAPTRLSTIYMDYINLYIGWCIYMGMQIYQNTNYKVYKYANGFIVHNTFKGFQDGHTHVQSYTTCMILIKLLLHKRLPKSRSKYFLESLLRLCDDENYRAQIQQLLLKI